MAEPTEVTLERNVGSTTATWTDRGYLCHEQFIGYTDNEIAQLMADRAGNTVRVSAEGRRVRIKHPRNT